MFSVGRYDPSLEDERKKSHKSVQSLEVTPSKKRKIDELENKTNEEVEDKCDDKEMESSSCPSSSENSSSSAPSSEESDDNYSISDESSAAFDVIAPEQKEDSLDSMRTKIKTTSEGIDDFDHEEKNDGDNEQSDEVKRAIRMSKVPIKDAAKIWELAPFLVENLKKDAYDSFFPIQSLVIPDVIASERHAHIRNRDICVASPTGSGKTLAFVIPVLNSLANRQVKRLRALVVLPSRDLGKFIYQHFHDLFQVI